MRKWPQSTLHIDDDPVILDVMQAIYKRSGQKGTLVSHSDPATALSKIQEIQPDLLLLDVKIPGLNTKDMLGQIAPSSADKTLKVIYVTGYDLPQDRIQSDNEAIEILGHIKKPLAPARTIEEIESLWR